MVDEEPCNCNPAERTGGGHASTCPEYEPECTCYEFNGGHEPGCPCRRAPVATGTWEADLRERQRSARVARSNSVLIDRYDLARLESECDRLKDAAREALADSPPCDEDACDDGSPETCECGGDDCERCHWAQVLDPPPWSRPAQRPTDDTTPKGPR